MHSKTHVCCTQDMRWANQYIGQPVCCCHAVFRFDYNNLVQAVGYLLAKQDAAKKEEYSKPIRDVMNLWLTASSNITYTPKVTARSGSACCGE